MVSKSLMKRMTIASKFLPRPISGYRNKDIYTEELYVEANILTPCQKSYYVKAVMFWRINNNNFEHEELFWDLALQ